MLICRGQRKHYSFLKSNLNASFHVLVVFLFFFQNIVAGLFSLVILLRFLLISALSTFLSDLCSPRIKVHTNTSKYIFGRKTFTISTVWKSKCMYGCWSHMLDFAHQFGLCHEVYKLFCFRRIYPSLALQNGGLNLSFRKTVKVLGRGLGLIFISIE